MQAALNSCMLERINEQKHDSLTDIFNDTRVYTLTAAWRLLTYRRTVYSDID